MDRESFLERARGGFGEPGQASLQVPREEKIAGCIGARTGTTRTGSGLCRRTKSWAPLPRLAAHRFENECAFCVAAREGAGETDGHKKKSRGRRTGVAAVHYGRGGGPVWGDAELVG